MPEILLEPYLPRLERGPNEIQNLGQIEDHEETTQTTQTMLVRSDTSSLSTYGKNVSQ